LDLKDHLPNVITWIEMTVDRNCVGFYILYLSFLILAVRGICIN